MVLVSELAYEVSEEVPKELSSERVLGMLEDVKANIGEVSFPLGRMDLAGVLKIVESGTYDSKGDQITLRIDLSAAKNIVENYRRESEGGCYSCVNLTKQVIDAQDATSGTYCGKSDPDFDSKKGVKFCGPSSKISKYADDGCIYWESKLSPPLEVLLEGK
jgi:hypothetical protein